MNLPSSKVSEPVSLALPLRRDHFAWFFVVDDDLYMNRENANLALSAFDPSTEIALGWSAHGFTNELGIITFYDRQFTSIQIEIVNPCKSQLLYVIYGLF